MPDNPDEGPVEIAICGDLSERESDVVEKLLGVPLGGECVLYFNSPGGSAYSALLGVIVIQSIASGLTLLDLSSSLRYMITGGVLAIAVIVDSLARRSRASHGRA